jgi:carbamoyl-phosphate synthase small subunit
VRHRRHRHPPPDPHPAREGRQNGCLMAGERSTRTRRWRPRGPSRAQGHGPREGGHHAEPYPWTAGTWSLGEGHRPGRSMTIPFHVVAYDFGVKRNILRMLADRGCASPWCRRRRRPRGAGDAPDGVFLSNGPGDPEPCDYAIDAIRELLDAGMPLFGICLGTSCWAGLRRAHREDEVRPPRRQPPGAGSGHGR